jgi:hypothetical protein
MDVKRLAIGTIVGGITLYVVGYLIFELAFGSFYAANVGSAVGALRSPIFQWAIALGNFSFALLFTLALETRAGAPSIAKGFITGATIGFLALFGIDAIHYGFTNLFRYVVVIIDPLLSAIHSGIAGAVIAAVLMRIPKSAGLQTAR